MSVVIVKTDAGAALEQDALANGAAMPRIEKLICIDAEPVTSALDIKELSTVDSSSISFEIGREDILFNSVDDLTTEMNTHIAPTTEVSFKAIGVVLEDGTLWGYAPYRVATNGLDKTADYGLSIVLVITRSSTDISINYEPYDTSHIIDRLNQEAESKIEATLALYIEENEASIIQLAANQTEILTRQLEYISVGNLQSGGDSNSATLNEYESDITDITNTLNTANSQL